VVAEPRLSFADLLRQLRAAARLTQEELAEAAGISPRSVSDLERGINRTARKDTALLLADALNLTRPVRAAFVAAARGRASAEEVLTARNEATAGNGSAAAASQTLPRDIGSFTGREEDLARLLETLADATDGGGTVAIHAIDGSPGASATDNSSCPCTGTPPVSGRSTRPTRWPACC
jgi:transcriptional regulator with XRE-family HTH domain